VLDAAGADEEALPPVVTAMLPSIDVSAFWTAEEFVCRSETTRVVSGESSVP
jgi:hypothetical protein